MKMDNIRKYISLRDSLVKEKNDLEQRLAAINDALGEMSAAPQTQAAAPAAPAAPAPQRSAGGSGGRRGRRPRSGLSLRDAVLQVTSGRSLTKEEILDGVKALGYKFTTNNPMNSLGVILYGKNPRFRNEGGRFSPAGGASQGSSGAKQGRSGSGGGGGGAFARKRRQLSPEAREKIAAAQRERWAKAKGGK